MGIIQIKEVNKAFKQNQVLKNFNLSINKGEIIGLIGPSGCGKSVLIKIIIGFLKPDSGKVEINSKEKLIGFSMQNNSIYEYLSVKQNLKYFSSLYHVPRKSRKERIENLLESLSLKQYEKFLVKDLSGGTKKRVDIACSLLNDPEIIILDEPFAGLDQELVERISNFIVYLQSKDKTIIISSHRMNELSKICSRIIKITSN